MKYHQVEVDDQIFQYVKSKAEPLEDTFNTALKRILFRETPDKQSPEVRVHPKTPPKGIVPNLPTRIPIALRQVLEVVYLVRSGPYDRKSATHFVAKSHGRFPQTVLDKYCRQLNLTASKFDRLLEQPGLGELKKILKKKFQKHNDAIDQVLE